MKKGAKPKTFIFLVAKAATIPLESKLDGLKMNSGKSKLPSTALPRFVHLAFIHPKKCLNVRSSRKFWGLSNRPNKHGT